MKRLTVVLALISLGTLSSPHPMPAVADVREDVAEMIEQARKGESGGGKDLHKLPLGEVVAELRKYANDPDKGVRMEVAVMATFLAKKHTERAARRQAAQLALTIAASDPDAGIARYASGQLLSFSSADFTPEMKKVIHGFLGRPNTYPEDVLLAGAAEVWSAEKKLRELAARNYWPARLALARMGDKAEIAGVIAKIEGEKDATEKVMRVDDLGYIRQPEAVEVLVRWLFRDDLLHPGNGSDVTGALYATTALDQLMEMTEGLPVQYWGRQAYSMADVKQAREWITKNGMAKLKIKR